MATNFPTSLDTYTDRVDSVDDVIAADVNDPHDAIEKLEIKVGVDSSAVTTSHDYRITQLRAGTGMTGSSQATAFIPTGSSVPSNGMYLPAANTLGFTSNTVLRWSANSAGNHVFEAPSSGTTVTINSVSGGVNAVLNGAANAIIDVKAAAANIAAIRLAGNGLTPGTGTFDIQQDGSANVDLNNRSGSRMSFYTNANERLQIGASGNVTINAPSSGRAFAVNAASGTAAAVFNSVAGQTPYFAFSENGTDTGFSGVAGSAGHILSDSADGDGFIRVETHDFRISTNAGTSSALVVTSDGRVYGKFLHNNAGSLTGAATQYIASGTYTPSINDLGNCGSRTPEPSNWIRVGNIVYVTGVAEIGVTSASTVSAFEITLPIASNLAAYHDLHGAANWSSGTSDAGTHKGGSVLGNATNDTAQVSFFASTSTTTRECSYAFSYEVL